MIRLEVEWCLDILWLEGRPKSDLIEHGVEAVRRLAEAKGYELPHFEMAFNDSDPKWVADEMVWLTRNHPDHPRI